MANMLSNISSIAQQVLSHHNHGFWLVCSATAMALIAGALYNYISRADKIPLLNPMKWSEFSQYRVKKHFTKNARAMLNDWFNQNPGKPASIYSEMGLVTVLPPELADEIRNDPRLNFREFNHKLFNADLAGFEPFRNGVDNDILLRVIAKDLTKQLTKVTAPLAEETDLALVETFGNSPEWRTFPIHVNMLGVIARISSRVFLGDQLCRDENWLRITKDYTVKSFLAASELCLWPESLRPIVTRFLKSATEVRALVQEAREVIEPIRDQRQQLRKKALAEGEEYERHNDAIDWVEDEAKGTPYNPVTVQLGLSLAAIHTTSDLSSKVLINLVRNPSIIEPLRREMTDVLNENGWSKNALFKMKLLDSVIKESQRLAPVALALMARIAKERIELSDGTVLPRGRAVSVSLTNMWDDRVHSDPDVWDGYRFYNMRQDESKSNSAQLVATSSDHLAFGHGKHACPGRFFAANEVKIVLVMILLQYDIAAKDGQAELPLVSDYGFTIGPHPSHEIQFRRRSPAEVTVPDFSTA